MAIQLTKLEKLLLPGFLILFELVFLIVYGLIVDYDEGGSPDHEQEVALQLLQNNASSDEYLASLASTSGTTKVYPFFQDVHVMIFVGFGFLMTFMRRYGYGSIAFNMLLACFAIQWSTITQGLFDFIRQHQDGSSHFTIFINLESLVNADFSAAAVLITYGALLGRASLFQLFTITFLEIIFYSVNIALNTYVFQAADVGGSMVIHTFGAYFGLATSIMLFRKKAKDNDKNSSVYHSDLFAMIGTLFLWLFWPSFNAGLASGNAQYRAIINTYYSLTGSVLATFICSTIVDGKRKLDMVHVQNATLAGGVAIGSVADMVIGPWAAILIGFISGIISVLGYKFLSPYMEKWCYLQDTCGVHNLHGLPGVFSAVASIIAAGVASAEEAPNRVNYQDSLYLVFPARAPANASDLTDVQVVLGVEEGLGRSGGVQAAFQLVLLLSTLGLAIVGGLITGMIAGYLPVFQPVLDENLFDDKQYWQLPDDAEKYLPMSEGEQPTDDSHPTPHHFIPEDERKELTFPRQEKRRGSDPIELTGYTPRDERPASVSSGTQQVSSV